MNVDKVYILEDRGILYINGEDCFEFLQNLITKRYSTRNYFQCINNTTC